MQHVRNKTQIPNSLRGSRAVCPASWGRTAPCCVLICSALLSVLRCHSPAPLEGGEVWLNASFTALSCFTRSSEAPGPPDTVVSWMHAEPERGEAFSTNFSFLSWESSQGNSLMVSNTVRRFHGWTSSCVAFTVFLGANPSWFVKMQLRTVLDVNVVDVQKRRNPSKHYVSCLLALCFFCHVQVAVNLTNVGSTSIKNYLDIFAMLAALSVHHFDPDYNWVDLAWTFVIHGVQRMNHTDFGDPLNLPLVPL